MYVKEGLIAKRILEYVLQLCMVKKTQFYLINLHNLLHHFKLMRHATIFFAINFTGLLYQLN